MYDEVTQFAADILVRNPTATTPPKKADHALASRLKLVLEKLEKHGFRDWMPGQVPDFRPGSAALRQRQDAGICGIKVRLVGNLVEKGVTVSVYMDLWNHYGRRAPKDVAYSVCRQSSDRGIIIGTMVRDIIRFTDLRDMVSHYDGGTWTERHFRMQLQCDANNAKLNASPELILSQLQSAVKQASELGITDFAHALLPGAGDDCQSADMDPYLVGLYGTMPVAIRLAHQKDLNFKMEFYIISPRGLCKLDFGSVLIGISGAVIDKEMDIGKLLAPTTSATK